MVVPRTARSGARREDQRGAGLFGHRAAELRDGICNTTQQRLALFRRQGCVVAVCRDEVDPFTSGVRRASRVRAQLDQRPFAWKFIRKDFRQRLLK